MPHVAASTNPFFGVEVHPHYGDNSAAIHWTVDAQYDGGKFFVYRSYSGANQGGWQLLNPRDEDGIELPIYGDQFIDDDLRASGVGGKRHKAWYRVLLEHNGAEYDSPIVAAYEDLSPHEFGLVRRILQQEAARMTSRRNGVPILMMFPSVQAGPCTACKDVDTGQRFYSSTCLECFGSGFKGGYNLPVQSYMELYGATPHKIQDTAARASDPLRRNVRMLAWPRPWPDMTLIVQPRTDERFLVGSVQHLKFKGIIPIAVQVELDALGRNHVAYKFPIQ